MQLYVIVLLCVAGVLEATVNAGGWFVRLLLCTFRLSNFSKIRKLNYMSA